MIPTVYASTNRPKPILSPFPTPEQIYSLSIFASETSDQDDEGRVSETEEETNEIPPWSIFPLSLGSARDVPITHQPYHADQWPIGFAFDGWTNIWQSEPIILDPYLKYNKDPVIGLRVPWSREETFRGSPFRLTIDLTKPHNTLPILTRGTAIACQDWDCKKFRYFIDHSMHDDDIYSYLRAYAFDEDHTWQDTWTSRPPLILKVPRNHSNVPFHPNLRKSPREEKATWISLCFLQFWN
jgi:hypothetical protein